MPRHFTDMWLFPFSVKILVNEMEAERNSLVYTKEMHLQLDESVKIMFKNIEEQLKSEMLCMRIACLLFLMKLRL